MKTRYFFALICELFLYYQATIYIIVSLLMYERSNYMDIHFRKQGKTVIAEIEGDIDHRFAEEIRRLTERELYISGADNLVLDMSSVKFMDSSGIGFIIGRYKTVSALGGKLSIASPSKEADRILSISGIYRIIKSYKSVDDAILGINQEVHN